MALTFLIGGADQTALVEVDSLEIEDGLNARNTASFRLFDRAGAYRPANGAEVIIADGAVRRFAGTIDQPEETQPIGTKALEGRIQCVGYEQVCDRHLVARVYENQTLGQIIRDIMTQDLAGENITVNNVQEGPVLTKVVFNYQTVSAALNELCELTGYAWYIDYYRDLHVFSRETNAAPFAITDSVSPTVYRNMRVTRPRDQYRNRQIVRAGHDETALLPETFAGDGQRRTFTVQHPLAKKPTIYVNGTAVADTDIGIRGLDQGKRWYWAKGEKEVTQADTEVTLAAADVLRVDYIGQVPIYVQAQDDDEISRRAAEEGGSGVYEAIEDCPDIDDRALAIEKARGLLRRYGRIPRVVEFETDQDGLAAGQLVNIKVAAHQLDGQFLIDSVRAKDVRGRFLRCTVRALDGESVGGWADFFRKLAQAGRKFVIRENEVVMLLRSMRDAVVCGDSLTVSTGAPESRVGYAGVGLSEVA